MSKLLKGLLKELREQASRSKNNAGATSWYSDRYQTITVQRNVSFLITIVSVVCIILSILTILTIENSKSIEPFVIEVEDKSGITNVVRPFGVDQITTDEALRKYFLNKYIQARETYNFNNFRYNYFTVVRTLSSEAIYSAFRNTTYSNNETNPISFGENGSINIKIRSMVNLTPPDPSSYLAQVIFSKEITTKNKTITENKVALIGYTYVDLKMNEAERLINPLGFQVISYKLDDYNL